MDAKTAIVNLNKRVLEANDAYYKTGNPIMSDAEFDQLLAQLKGLAKKYPEFAALATTLTNVGSDLNGNGRVKHVRPMLSIENNYAKTDLKTYAVTNGIEKGEAFLEEPKRDGISCELRYEDGELKFALTRGDGESGEDMTAQVKALKSIPQRLAITGLLPSRIHLRGELAMRNTELARINAILTAKGEKPYMSTRNLTAGTMKQKDLSVVASREIVFLPWDMYSPNQDEMLPDSAFARMTLAHTMGFPKYEGVLVTKADAVVPALDKILTLNATSDINADGVVIKVDSHKSRARLGVGSKYTNYQCCFKPQAAAAPTVVRSVEWGLGRTGKLTPVAICDPVILAGAQVTHATLNNESWTKAKFGGLKVIGAEVRMLRSGDVIPCIDEVTDVTNATEMVLPTVCPECGETLKIDDEGEVVTRWCENSECKGRVRDLFAHIGDRDQLEIDGLGDDMAAKLVNDNFATNVAELFEFQVTALQYMQKFGDELFATKMKKQGFNVGVVKMVKSMETAKKAEWPRWFTTFSIPMVGETLGKVLTKALNLDEESMADLPAKLLTLETATVEGIGTRKRDAILSWAKNPHNVDLCKRLYIAGVRPKGNGASAPVSDALKGVAFCITGSFSEDRNELTKKLESLGAKECGSVSKNCTHLIVGEAPGKSKLDKYEALTQRGIKIQKVGAYWLAETLKANGMEMKGTGGKKFDSQEA